MSLFKNHTAAHSSWCFRGRKKTYIHYHAWKIKKDPVGFFLPLSACSTWSWAEISPMCAGRPTQTYWRHWRGSCLKWALCISITGNGEKKTNLSSHRTCLSVHGEYPIKTIIYLSHPKVLQSFALHVPLEYVCVCRWITGLHEWSHSPWKFKLCPQPCSVVLRTQTPGHQHQLAGL